MSGLEEEYRDIYSELTDELYNTFSNILSNVPEDSAWTRYRSEDAYEGRQDKGRIAIGSDNSDDLSYAYRMRFNAKPNQPEKVVWYGTERGFNNISVILGEKDLILNKFISRYANRTDIVDEDQYEYIQKLFEDLIDCKRELQRHYSIDNLIDVIDDHDERTLQDVISSDRRSAVEIWKLLYSRNNSGEIVENDIEYMYRDDTTLLVRCMREYHNGSKSREYPMCLLFEQTGDLDRFFIRRIPRCDRIDDPDHKWNKSDILEALGCDVDLTFMTDKEIPKGKKSRISEDLLINPSRYDMKFRELRDKLYGQIQVEIHKTYNKFYKDEKDIDLYNKKARITSKGLGLDQDLDTEEVIDIQKAVEIPENAVREEQERRNIGRLSANLRSEILKDLHTEKFCDWLFEKTASEIRNYQIQYEENRGRDIGRRVSRRVCGITAQDEIRSFLIEAPSDLDWRGLYNLSNYLSESYLENTREVRIEHNGTKITIPDSSGHPNYMSLNGFDRRRVATFFVPKKVKMQVNNNEFIESYKLPQGFYELRNLDDIQTIRYS